MRRIGWILAALLLGGCATEPVAAPEVRSASAEAAARAEFTVVAVGEREPFPSWSGQGLDGYAWSTELLRGRVVVVNFWASWCQPCRDEWPELQAAAAGHPSVRFVGVNTLDQRSEARAFVTENPTQYRHAEDAKAELLRGITSLPAAMMPTTVILDRGGAIAAWKVGPVLRGQIRRALAAMHDLDAAAAASRP